MNWRKLQLRIFWGWLSVSLSISIFSQSQLQPAGKNRALIFAISDYLELDTLETSLAKASNLASLLQRDYSFQAEIVANPTADQIESKLKEYRFFYRSEHQGTFASDGQLLIYFIGHAHRIQQRSYLFPKDVIIRKMTKTAIPLAQFSKWVNEIDCDHILLGVEGFLGSAKDLASLQPDSPFLLADSLTVDGVDSLATSSWQNRKTRRFIGLSSDEYFSTDEANLSHLLYENLAQVADLETVHLPHLVQQLISVDSSIYCGGFGKLEAQGDFVFQRRSTYEYEGVELPETLAVALPSLVLSPPSRKQQDSQMIYVDGSVFWKGDEFKVGEADESPLHLVEVKSFLISGFEVTQKEFKAFCMARGIEREFEPNHERLPVNNVSWYEAIEYCNWLSLEHGLAPVYSIDKRRKDIRNANLQDKLKWKVSENPKADGYRLPTESEWEFAARSRGKHHIWTGTREEKEVAQFANFRHTEPGSDSLINVAPVGSLASNSLGLFDMSGNVAEWCWDWYDEKYYSLWTDKNVISTAQQGPRRGKFRVAKGGAWTDPIQNIRVSKRIPLRPDAQFETIGFRLVRSVP